MAKKNPGSAKTASFDKSLNEDVKDYHASPQSWSQARNAVNNTTIGDLGDLSNEASNALCIQAPYTIIGGIHLESDKWVIFSTDNVNSEIGLFSEDQCDYTTIVNDPCLAFNQDYLIIGISKETYECHWQVYWSDALNPDRTLDIDDIPWIEDCVVEDDCLICTDTTDLDCDKLLLEPKMDNLQFQVNQGPGNGELLNGTYYVVGAYVENGQRISDWSLPSNALGLFNHTNLSSALDITILNSDKDFDEFELCLVQLSQGSTLAYSVGIYSTHQQKVAIDAIIETWTEINPGLIPLVSPIAEKSDGIYETGKYSIRVGPTSKFDFNYQPLANQIQTSWLSVEYPMDYYGEAGINVGYMRDEVYALFIRWVFETGDKSPSFHIPGRASDTLAYLGAPNDTDLVGGDDAIFDVYNGLTPYRWVVHNTAAYDPAYAPAQTLPDGGVVLGGGPMAYWESTEKYPDKKPEIYNATSDPIWGVPDTPTNNHLYDLCGKKIRHHKMPTNATDVANTIPITNHFTNNKIRVLGLKFDNVLPPLDNNGVPIKGVVGYEILRGSREGNKSILAKGMLNNMRFAPTTDANDGRIPAYANHPYNDLSKDSYFQFIDSTTAPGMNEGDPPQASNFICFRNMFTFHSPETNFRDPFLSAKEIAIYGELRGITDGGFVLPSDQPKAKFITDFAFVVCAIGGLGIGAVKKAGKTTNMYGHMGKVNLGIIGNPVMISNYGPVVPLLQAPFETARGLAVGAAALIKPGTTGGLGAELTSVTGGGFSDYYKVIQTADQVYGAGAPGSTYNPPTQHVELSPFRAVAGWMRVAQGVNTFAAEFAGGVDTFMDLIRACGPYRDFALQYQSHCYYNFYVKPIANNTKRGIEDAVYLRPQIQDFTTFQGTTTVRVNNLFRANSVLLSIDNAGTAGQEIQDPGGNGANIDQTNVALSEINTKVPAVYRQWTMSGDDTPHKQPLKTFRTNAASHYVGLKQRLRNQYGQLEGVIQVPVSTGKTLTANTSTDILFGGDIYVARYTEKNTCFMFYDWCYDQPDGYGFDYSLRLMMPWTRYWADTNKFETNTFFRSMVSNLLNTTNWIFPSRLHYFDRVMPPAVPPTFLIKEAYYYLFTSGVRDFFVESEINVGYRDWGDALVERHYSHRDFADLKTLFDINIIKSGNYYKYEYALSVSRLFNNYIRWADVHPRDYNPFVAEKCYTYRPNRIIYSLPQETENKSDNWRIFLPFNYKDFKSRVTSVRPIGKNGALFLFENESPAQVAGVDVLQTDAGTKLTIGDGGLFSQPLQHLVNTDEPNEYGSCQNRLSVVNSPGGLYWMSQNQGKIFSMSGGMKEISNIGMKWWFSTYLPYRLTLDFPDFELTDNPITGIGCQAIFDNDNQIVYFCKKDYELRTDLVDTLVEYVEGHKFKVNRILDVDLGDPDYFRDASWTISWDPKTQAWISYHDWHPDLTLSSKNTFMSTKAEGVWTHNQRCDSYCNFYNEDFPFEVEYAVHTNLEVMTLRSVEIYLEAFKYADNCFDRFHDLDYFFDEAVIYNSEQCSGLLNLNLAPKNDAPAILNYPQINFSSIDILYSKVEQKYRFNQFWDITADRGEFNPAAQRMIFNTEPNGYIRNLNPNNLDYNKFALERKKFRHYKQSILLRKEVSGDKNIVVALAIDKNLVSPR